MHTKSLAGSFAGAAAPLLAAMPVHAQTLHATLESYQEVPAVSRKGSGEFRARIDKEAGTIYWELNHGNLEGAVLQAHIHFGQHGVNGGISVFLCTNLGNGPAGMPTCPSGSANLGKATVLMLPRTSRCRCLGPCPDRRVSRGAWACLSGARSACTNRRARNRPAPHRRCSGCSAWSTSSGDRVAPTCKPAARRRREAAAQ